MQTQKAKNKDFSRHSLKRHARRTWEAPRLLALLWLSFIALTITSCAPLYVDPNAGGETIFLKTLKHADQFEVEYLRQPEEGPLAYNGNAWTLLWFIPLNRQDLGLWIRDTLPEGAEAANIRAKVQTPWYGHWLYWPTIGLIRLQRVHYEMDPVHYKPSISEGTP